MLKVKHKRVVRTEELTKPREADQSFPYTNLPSQSGRNGEGQKEQCSPCDCIIFITFSSYLDLNKPVPASFHPPLLKHRKLNTAIRHQE